MLRGLGQNLVDFMLTFDCAECSRLAGYGKGVLGEHASLPCTVIDVYTGRPGDICGSLVLSVAVYL